MRSVGRAPILVRKVCTEITTKPLMMTTDLEKPGTVRCDVSTPFDTERIVVSQGFLQGTVDALQRAAWVNALAPWRIIAHLTFSWEASFDSGRRVYEKFMARKLPHVSYFYALEQNPSRDGCHVHALWADCGGVYRKEVWADWFQRYGRCRVEPVRNYEDVCGYCSKYCTKEAAWWNVNLQWHRKQKLNGSAFTLAAGPSLS